MFEVTDQMSNEKRREVKQNGGTHKPCLFPSVNLRVYFLPKLPFLISTVSQAKRHVCFSQFQLANRRPKSISGFLDASGWKETRAAAARAGHLQRLKFHREATVNLDSTATSLNSNQRTVSTLVKFRRTTRCYIPSTIVSSYFPSLFFLIPFILLLYNFLYFMSFCSSS
jgi:hypothetical protein